MKDNQLIGIESYKWQLDNGYDGSIPIIDFGKHEYGDLSYTIGAICLYKLSEFVGIDVFEEATKIFLQKYKDTPVSMEIFCDEYIKLYDKPELERFFKDWIYSTNSPKSLCLVKSNFVKYGIMVNHMRVYMANHENMLDINDCCSAYKTMAAVKTRYL